jgi:hypothetical protein
LAIDLESDVHMTGFAAAAIMRWDEVLRRVDADLAADGACELDLDGSALGVQAVR